MKQRLEFNTDNTKDLSAAQLETVNRGYDLWYDAHQFHGADFKGWQVRSEAAKTRILEVSAQVAAASLRDRLDSETADPPDTAPNAVQPHRVNELARGSEGQGVWPPKDGTTGPDPVDPNTLEPLPATVPGVG